MDTQGRGCNSSLDFQKTYINESVVVRHQKKIELNLWAFCFKWMDTGLSAFGYCHFCASHN